MRAPAALLAVPLLVGSATGLLAFDSVDDALRLAAAAAALVERTRKVTDLAAAVGLGVSSGSQAAEIARFADGVIVGSAFVQRMLDANDPTSGRRDAAELASELAAGVRSARS